MTTSVGQPIDRVDGHVKITGAAKYAADYPMDGLAYGVPVQSTIAKGKVLRLDTEAASQAPGVLTVISRANLPKLRQPQNDFGSSTKLGETRPLFADDVIHYAGQYLAFVVADTLERAITAATLVRVEVQEEPPVLSLDSGEQFQPPDDFAKSAYQRGDASAAFASAAHQLRETFSTPVEHHNPMEPSATIAVWQGGKLTLYDATQWVAATRNVVADTLGIARDNVHIISRYVGGGFGCKAFVWPHSLLAAIAARQLRRPVKVALARQHMFTSVGHRGATRQTISLGADAAGKLEAIQHENLTHASTVDDFIERCGVITGFLYDCPNVSLRNTGARVNIATPTPMRAPGETPGLFALESALDELAWKLNIDPIELRLRNYAESDAEKGRPYSSKHLRECYATGMQRFGWTKREGPPGSQRDGRYLIGWGMATATYPGYRSPGAARVRIFSDGRIVVASATQDLGTGTYTTMAQIAADVFGIAPSEIRIELGDSSLPPAPVSGGSMTTASVTPAIKAAAEDAVLKLKLRAIDDANSPLHGLTPDDIVVDGGTLRAKLEGAKTSLTPNRSISFADVLRGANLEKIESEADVAPGEESQKYAIHSFGAQFSEVRVDTDTYEIRVTKHIGVFDIGRVINTKTARSQALSGITMGIGMALFEHTVYDPRHGRVVTNNLADYAMPVNADIGDVDALFVEYPDPAISSVGARGVGEIGITGVAPAIANAIYHATGIRVRDLPITPEKLLGTRLGFDR